MLEQLITSELSENKSDIDNIKTDKTIDCVTIFSTSKKDYINRNDELVDDKIVDEMPNGTLYHLHTPIKTPYGNLSFIKIRRPDNEFDNYRISVDFTVKNYGDFKNTLNNPAIKKYDTFELIQFKNDKIIINIVSLSAKDDYNLS